jgi:hypothetical protein
VTDGDAVTVGVEGAVAVGVVLGVRVGGIGVLVGAGVWVGVFVGVVVRVAVVVVVGVALGAGCFPSSSSPHPARAVQRMAMSRACFVARRARAEELCIWSTSSGF